MNIDLPKNMSFLDFAGGAQLLPEENTKTFLPAILVGISVTGGLGNLLVLLILTHDFRTGRGSEFKALLVTLNSTDLLILVLCAPVRAITYYQQTWTLGTFVCRTADWFQHSCLVAKSLVLAASSNARHNFVTSTCKSDLFNTTKVYGALVFILMASMSFPIPQVMFVSLKPYGDIDLCVYEMPMCASDFMNVFNKIYPTATFVIPIFFTLAFYTRALRNTKSTMNHAATPQLQTKAIPVMLCVSGANAFMLLPEWGTWTWIKLGDVKPPVGLVIFAQVFLYACSAISPIIFLSIYDDVRQGLADLWRFLTCRTSKHITLSRSPKAEGNGSETGPMIINSALELERASSSARPEVVDGTGKTFPDVALFWTERRNTAVEEDQDDPVPWEREEKYNQ